MTTSSITFNVGAPTFGVRFTLSSEGQLCHHFCDLSHSIVFPNWNDSPPRPSMTLKTNSLVKPSSNTLNVGAPTFQPVAHPFRGEALRNFAEAVSIEGKPSGLKSLSCNPVVPR